MTTSHEQNKYQALKDELRRMRRPSAPWYLESDLHRRLHSPHKRTPYVGVGPILIIATTFVTLSIAVYVTLINPMLGTQRGTTHPAVADSSSTALTRIAGPDSSRAAVPALIQPRQKLQDAMSGRTPARVPDSLQNRTARRGAVRAVAADSIPVARRPSPAVPAGEELPVPPDTGRVE
jgi:hypothetical protein